MARQLPLEEKHRLLNRALHRNFERKRSIELTISRQWKELRKLEIELEKIHEIPTARDELPRLLSLENVKKSLKTREPLILNNWR